VIRVCGDSMSPTLKDGEFVVIDSLILPRVGDLALIDTELGPTLHRVLSCGLTPPTPSSPADPSQQKASQISVICAGDHGQRIDLVDKIQGVAIYQITQTQLRQNQQSKISEPDRANFHLKPLRHSGFLYRVHLGIAKLARLELQLSGRNIRLARGLRRLSKMLRKFLIIFAERYAHHFQTGSVP